LPLALAAAMSTAETVAGFDDWLVAGACKVIAGALTAIRSEHATTSFNQALRMTCKP
jgi:hypothetical protein